ncbi:hypothetical protein KO489_07955, partial [Reinekea forsetii]|nr:hypothetical protein [Reinekea forsetii]
TTNGNVNIRSCMVKASLLLICLLSPLFLHADGMPLFLKLENGEVLKVDGYEKLWAGSSNEWVLVLRYESDDVEDKVLLRNRASIIWKSFRPLVDQLGFEYAGIKAIKYDGPRLQFGNRKFKAYTKVLFKSGNGEWTFYPDKN